MAMDKQMELFEPVTRGFDEGGLLQEGGTVDPVSGNEVPTGSTQEEVRDDIPAQLSEGEFVMPADVVRYHGLDKMMALRDEAKMGLARMEAMGQMGNADEATIPDGVPFDAANLPFDINDLDLEEDTNEYQVGGFVPAPQVQLPGVSYQQSQFAGYQPQYQQYQQPQVPQQPQTPQYQAPQQQFTPTVTGQAPSFGALVQPTTVTYYDKDGNTLQIPVDANGNPLIPIPPGFSKTKPQTATQAPSSAATGTGTGAPQIFTSEGGESSTDDNSFAMPKIDADVAAFNLVEQAQGFTGPSFASQVSDIKEKGKSTLAGGIIGNVLGSFKTQKDINAAKENQIKMLSDSIGLSVEDTKNVMDTFSDEIRSGYRDPVTGEVSGQKDLRTTGQKVKDFATDVFDKVTGTQPAGRDEFGNIAPDGSMPVTDITKTATKAKDITDRQVEDEKAADLSSPRVETTQTRREGEAAGAATKADIKYENLTDAQKEMVDSVAPKSYSEETAKMLGVEYDERLEGKELTPAEQSIVQDRVTQDMMGSRDEPTRTSVALSGADDRRQAEQIIQERQAEQARQAAIETERFAREASRSQTESAKRASTIAGHAARYERQGYSSSAARAAAVNKTDADNEARRQTNNPNASAATSSSGNAIRSSSGKVVVSGSSVSDDGGGDSGGDSGGGGCCFIMLEARYGDGTMDDVVRRYRDEHMTERNKRGYYKLAEVFVPLMRKSSIFKWLVTKTFADPLVSYGKYYYGQNKHGMLYYPIKAFWMKMFDILGEDTEFVRENGEVV